MTSYDGDKTCTTKPGPARRRILQGIGVGGLAAAASVFGFAKPAYAYPAQCCNLSCPHSEGFTMKQCMTGNYYVWYCKNPNGTECACCEHDQPGKNGCNKTSYSMLGCYTP